MLHFIYTAGFRHTGDLGVSFSLRMCGHEDTRKAQRDSVTAPVSGELGLEMIHLTPCFREKAGNISLRVTECKLGLMMIYFL